MTTQVVAHLTTHQLFVNMQSKVRSPSLAKSSTLTPVVRVYTKWCSADKRMCIHNKRISDHSRARLVMHELHDCCSRYGTAGA
jgi:hypothetical protein